MASKCTKCGNTENYNFALNIGLCDPCIGEQIEKIETENAKLNIILYHRENGLSHPDFNAEIEISKQAERIKELETDIENRRKYETYLQSSEHPVYSYAIWLNQ